MKNKKLVKVISASCIALTLLCCIGGMVPKIIGETASAKTVDLAMEDPPAILWRG